MKKLITILLCFLCGINTVVQGRTRIVRHYTINEGLANNAVYSIAQDKKGRMWFGTIDGLHSYDGTRIRIWRDGNASSLGSNIYTIIEDDRQQLWVGSDFGLSLLNLKTEQFSTFDRQTTSGDKITTPVTRIVQASDQRIWIATMGQGVFCYTPSSGELLQYAALGKINSDYIYDVIEDKSGTIWVASSDAGISKLDPMKEGAFQPVAEEDVRNTTTIFEDAAQNIWVGSRNDGLYLLDKKKNRLVQKLEPINSKRVFQVRSIVELSPGELLIASDEGLTRYNTRTEEKQIIRSESHTDNELNDNYLQTLFIDREEGLWIGTYFGGVNYVAPTAENFLHYCPENTPIDGKILSVFAKADNGNLWLGTDDAGFFYWNRTKNTFKSYKPDNSPDSPTYHNIHALLQDGEKLYIGMYMGGLDILDLKTGKFKNHKFGRTPQSMYASSVYALCKDSRKQLWVGTPSGLNKYRPVTDDFERIYEVHPADISYILEDKQGLLWVCSTNKGIYRLDSLQQQWKHYTNLPTQKVITACEDKNGNLWFGTDGQGLLKYDSQQDNFVKLPLPKNIRVIYKIIADKDELWITTSHGLYCYQPESGNIRTYDKNDGLQENQFLPNSGIQLADGTIFIGGIHGFNEFHPANITRNPRKPVVILSDFQLFNLPVKVGAEDSPLTTSITYTEKLKLKHHHSIFSLSVATLSYINPTKSQYRYKLDGFEKEWIETNTTPHVTYTNLPPGHYIFRVSCSNGDGIWHENVVELPIRILPPWWASVPCVILYVCLTIGILAYAYYRMVKKQKRQLDIMTIEKDKEIYQSKVAFFTQMIHEIRTPLTLILAPLENVMRSTGSIRDAMPQLMVIERNGKRLLNLVNQLMDLRKVESGGMDVNPVNTEVKGILSSIYQNFYLSAELKQIKLILNMPEGDCYALIDSEAFTTVVTNLLSNALKFTASHIWMDLLCTEDRKLELRVKDNGQGIAAEEQEKIFSAFYQIKKNQPSDNIGTGVGLLLVKKLVGLMHGELKLESEPGMGSTFIIRFKQSESENETTALPKQALSLPEALTEEENPNHHHLLIVDDNQDLREYLRDLLSPIYKISCATNGKEALELLKKQHPDLVISDVMMPVMDGMELCKRMKQNLQTSHIPVVLLSAKVDTNDYVEGLETGADLYLAKPFSSDIIKAQLHSLLTNRERIKGSYKNEPMSHLDIVAHSSLDKAFLKKIATIVEQQMTDSDFTVDALAQEVGISRTGLFTKIKAISGMTPNDLIRLIRLKKAAELLSHKDVQVSEACFQVGFSSPSYFTKCFQAQFGVSPTEFKRMKQENV